jgi:pyridoxine 4-dehydrogenase
MASAPRTVSVAGHQVNRIGLGTNRLTDTPENRSFLEAAVAEGLEFIDTAHVYTSGQSERAIGAALAPLADGPVVATKGGYRGGGTDELRAQLEESFERLGVETISLYYLHRADPEVPLEETMGVLKEYRDEGRVEHIGLSQVSVEQIQRARNVVPIAAVQNEYNLGDRGYDDVLDYCTSEEIVFVPFYPLRGGGRRALAQIAERHGATHSQIKLAWLLHRSPAVAPIPGTLDLDHLGENLAALDIELSDEDLEALSAA